MLVSLQKIELSSKMCIMGIELASLTIFEFILEPFERCKTASVE
jgi:hypothetical protein